MARRIDGYVDTSALIAFADRADAHHPLFLKLFARSLPLITTTLVIAEGMAGFFDVMTRLAGAASSPLLKSGRRLRATRCVA